MIRAIKELFRHWFKGEHFYIPTLSDTGHPIEVCWICGGQDGKKFWAKLNELYDKEFPNKN